MPLKLALTSILFLYTTFLLSGQSLTYKVIYKKDSIGYLTAEKTHKDGQVFYKIDSEVSFRVVARFNLEYHFNATYDEGVLEHGFTRYLLNGKEKSYSEIERQGNRYLVDFEGKTNFLEHQGIEYSILMSYHHEPNGFDEIFSERHAEILPVRRLNDGTYELTQPDGRKNFYTYDQNGICTSVEVDIPLATLNFVLVR